MSIPAEAIRYNTHETTRLHLECTRQINTQDIIIEVWPEKILSVQVNAVPPMISNKKPNRCPVVPDNSISGGLQPSIKEEGKVVISKDMPRNT
jgi:hypothetical protein